MSIANGSLAINDLQLLEHLREVLVLEGIQDLLVGHGLRCAIAASDLGAEVGTAFVGAVVRRSLQGAVAKVEGSRLVPVCIAGASLREGDDCLEGDGIHDGLLHHLGLGGLHADSKSLVDEVVIVEIGAAVVVLEQLVHISGKALPLRDVHHVVIVQVGLLGEIVFAGANVVIDVGDGLGDLQLLGDRGGGGVRSDGGGDGCAGVAQGPSNKSRGGQEGQAGCERQYGARHSRVIDR
mmetsp:Transcript_7457/g.21063  ORF Transcript_7457/g.21063 Transcript_7457/m.21063 type:complete len:237 (+) Transcript_7457:630-1340(+)